MSLRLAPRCASASCAAGISALALAASLVCVILIPANAHPTPAFGDSGWVAPLPPHAFDEPPAAAGARIARTQHEPTGERILRAPFRVAFFPVRLFARGLETLSGANLGPLNTLGRSHPGFSIGPSFSYSGGAGLGLGLRTVSVLDERHAARWRAEGTWSVHDSRKALAAFDWGAERDPVGVSVRTSYAFMPNHRFYGIGNASSEANRTTYLSEAALADVDLRLGPVTNAVRLLGSVEGTGARRGYNGETGVLERFSLAEAPGMLGHFTLLSFGVGGVFGRINDRREPSRGFEARAEVRQTVVLASGDPGFRRYRVEARGFVPLGSARRVIALRAVQQSVAASHDAAALPFYLLPESGGQTRFAAYPRHRFTDRHLAFAHAEYRWLIWDRLWAVGLAEAGEVASRADRLRFDAIHRSTGGGLRYAFTGTSVARFQAAHGSEGLSATITLNEDF